MLQELGMSLLSDDDGGTIAWGSSDARTDSGAY
jgi:hypothetical protein